MFTYYWRKKKAEWKAKAALYEMMCEFLDNRKEIPTFIRKLYTALKDVPTEDLQREFIAKLAEIIHEENTRKA